ncbi:hypothetical protein T552_00601 [Pneumocystis carinii B80]|uniref:DUF1640 domain-containing protein n=1 Tax=Pneumocystis carinii (strain B80) TaxID=1408658 RepID=A0A0W4ZP39_PNEC8|nr:hypothetical protein T552_00601 [Pneumocystis carinii B80]KTW30123.1 hypothetical protein T552_00601 [Pneumocystis carinii B80]
MIQWKQGIFGILRGIQSISRPYNSFKRPVYRFSTQSYRARKYFDTLQLVKQLEKEGFTKQQSLAVVQALHAVMEENFHDLTKTMATKEEQERINCMQKMEFSQLRSELQTLEKNDITSTRREYDRIAADLEKLKSSFREEINHTLSNVRLDLNLEKGRIRDEYTAHEIKIKETDTRIENEINNIKTQAEAIKLQTFQWLVGIVTGGGALVLAYVRLVK